MVREVFDPLTGAVAHRLPGWLPEWLVNLAAPRRSEFVRGES